MATTFLSPDASRGALHFGSFEISGAATGLEVEGGDSSLSLSYSSS